MAGNIESMLRLNAVSLAITALLLQSGCERLEMIERSYGTLADAVKAEAVGNDKWIPTLLPPSATEIKEVHNIDTNETWLTFRFDFWQVSTIDKRCKRVGIETLARARKRPRPWWPESLVRGAAKTQPNGQYRYYQCGAKSFLSIDSVNNMAYYWTLS